MPIFNRRNPDPPREDPVRPGLESYAGRLKHIGRVLDQARVRSVAIVEVSGNYIVRAIDQKSGDLVLSEIVQEDFERGVNGGSRTPPLDSYEALLPVIGQDLDERMAANVTIVELDQQFDTVGWVHGTAAGRSTYVAIDRNYPRAMLQSKAKPDR